MRAFRVSVYRRAAAKAWSCTTWRCSLRHRERGGHLGNFSRVVCLVAIMNRMRDRRYNWRHFVVHWVLFILRLTWNERKEMRNIFVSMTWHKIIIDQHQDNKLLIFLFAHFEIIQAGTPALFDSLKRIVQSISKKQIPLWNYHCVFSLHPSKSRDFLTFNYAKTINGYSIFTRGT